MAIHLPPETRTALGEGLLPECKSRSLFKDRFADPESTADSRKAWFNALITRKAEARKTSEWLPDRAELLHARLMSRLLVDLGGGVMENANVQLDRYGIPVIPGSAVKGCARRMALQALHDWVEAKSERPETDDVCGPCCDGFSNHAALLAAIARIFGWTPEDWTAERTKNGHFKSDFAWATKGDEGILKHAKLSNPGFDTFSGSIAFLAASPNRDPGLELDVVTPHHAIYHSPEPDRHRDPKKWEIWQAHRNAPDVEDPIPVYFPAVRSQDENDYFTFPLISLRLANKGDMDFAKRWLAHGLEILGLGAKTSAGYGWFQNVTHTIEGHHLLAKRLDALEAEFAGFELWPTDQKDTALLQLLDRKEDCRIWLQSNRTLFRTINAYAMTQSLTLE